MSDTSAACPECGAAVPLGGSCRDNFHALLLREGEVPGVPGTLLHFYAVACYNLQHPESMNFTAEALGGLQVALRDTLEGCTDIDDLRRRGRRYDGPKRVLRQSDDPIPELPRGPRTLNVRHVIDCEISEYRDRLMQWVRAVVQEFDSPIGSSHSSELTSSGD